MATVNSFGNEKKENTGKKLEYFIGNNRKILIAIIAIIVLVAVSLCVAFAVSESGIKKGLAAVDAIEFSFVKDSDGLDEAAATERRETALKELAAYTTKENVVGVRANMLSADISFQKEDYSAAAAFYLAAADCGEDSYTAPLCFFNAAVSYEQAGNNKDAVKYYEKASEYKDFLRRTHAIFSAGRVSESLQDFEGAKKFYSTLEEKYPSDSWTDIAKTRLISLKIAGKIE